MRTPYFNASMAPNGMMQVWSGLLLRMDNEAQMATILAHETGHYLKRHSLQQMRDAKARAAAATLLSGFGIYGLAGQLLILGTAFAFSRDQEREADAIGLVLMRQCGYDTREAPKVWANLLAELAANPAAADNSLDSILFATHPTSEERQRTLEREAAGGSGNVGAEAWRQRIAPLRGMLLDDELKRGRFDESLVLLNRLVAAEADSAELLYYRGEARRLRGASGDLPLALIDLEAAARDPKAPPAAWRALGHAYRPQQPAAARAAWQRYLELARCRRCGAGAPTDGGTAVNRTRRAVLLLGAAMLLSSCAQLSQVATGQVVVGGRLVVDVDKAWNQFEYQLNDGTPTWTQQGITVDALKFYVGLKDGA